MNLNIAVISLLGLSFQVISASTTIYLLAGQSNLDGRADISGFSAVMQSSLDSVDYYYGNDPGGADATPTGVLTTIRGNTSETGKTGIAVPMAHHLAANTAGDIAFIKYGNGGTGFSSGEWSAGGDSSITGDGLDYRRFQNVVSEGLLALQMANPTETYNLGGIVWVQGERDAVQAASTAAYQSNLTGFIDDVRLTYGADLSFFFSRLSDNQSSINSTNLANIQAAQDNVNSLVANTHLLNTDSFSVQGDDLHFDAEGYTALGNGLSQLVINSVPEPSSAALLGLGALGLVVRRKRA